VLGRTYDTQACSMARSLEVVGERWTLLILRDIFLGIRKFEDLHRSLGVARNILQARLELLTEEGVVEKRPYQEGRFEYCLTPKGRELWPALMALLRWGDRYYAPHGRPRLIKHRECGGEVTEHLTCEKCGESLTLQDVYWEWGPGAKEWDKPQRRSRRAPSRAVGRAGRSTKRRRAA
jgi:DNA-binding HxlR family transcriptional regulator